MNKINNLNLCLLLLMNKINNLNLCLLLLMKSSCWVANYQILKQNQSSSGLLWIVKTRFCFEHRVAFYEWTISNQPTNQQPLVIITEFELDHIVIEASLYLLLSLQQLESIFDVDFEHYPAEKLKLKIKMKIEFQYLLSYKGW